MRWKRFAHGLLAREGANGRHVAARRRSLLGGKLVRGGRGFELLEFKLHLVEKTRLAFALRAVNLPSHLLDCQPQMRNQGRGARRLGPGPRKLGIAGKKETLQRLDIIGKRIIGAHRRRWNHNTVLLCAPACLQLTHNAAINRPLAVATYIVARANRFRKADNRIVPR
jgi:hypothetical protein